MNVGPILAEAYRGEYPENRFTGWLAVSDAIGTLLYSTPGTQEISTFFRSSAKPFQAFPLVQKGFNLILTSEELALCCASHSATPQHLMHVEAILQKANFSQTCLQCGPHPPLNAESEKALVASGQKPQAIHNNCSGKHAGMLLYCAKAGLDPNTYLDFDHPLQQHILSVLKEWTGLSEIPRAIDGCGAPVFYMPIPAMATLYAKLGADPEIAPIVQAMTLHPVLIGGEGRIDTVLMQITGGRLLAKVGADGVLGVSHLGENKGLLLKVADGSGDIRNMYTVWALLQLGWLSNEEYNHPALRPFTNTQRMNTRNREVGEIRFYWPVFPA